jgi:hypothetical protein
VLKEHQPLTLEAVAVSFADPWTPRAGVVEGDRHGDREERRTLEAATEVVASVREAETGPEEEQIGGWPGLGQGCRVQREGEEVNGRRAGTCRSEWADALTGLTPAQASPERLLQIWRGQWQIENGLDSRACGHLWRRCQPDPLWTGSCRVCRCTHHSAGAAPARQESQCRGSPAALCDVSLGSTGAAGYHPAHAPGKIGIRRREWLAQLSRFRPSASSRRTSCRCTACRSRSSKYVLPRST